MASARSDAAMTSPIDALATGVISQDDIHHSAQDTATSATEQGLLASIADVDTPHDNVKEKAHEEAETTASPKAATIAAERLPIEILQKILYQVHPETFASATLVSRNWRNAANDAKLYAHHLSHSPLYSRQNSVITGPWDETRLAELKREFVQEAKRCLFTPFLRPKVTIVNLISETPLSSFAAGPGGEKFDFTFSQFGRWCLAISSSRIYVVDLRGKDTLKAKAPFDSGATEEADAKHRPADEIEGSKEKKKADEVTQDVKTNILRVAKELKVVRRPLAADILADGSVLAVLSSDHKVSLYNLKEDRVELRRTVDLDNTPYTISMSAGGEILAAAFDGGMELCSLRENASPSERRTVKCHRVDRLMFSSDGSMLLGTTSTKDPATVILTAPYFNAMEHDLTQAEMVNSMWTQQILFPSSSRDCSHSTLLPRYGDDNSNWTLTYDRTYESFRAVRTDDLRNGTTYFPGPQNGTDRRIQWPKDALVPSSLPSTTARGDLVAAGFKGSEIWLYGVPDNLDANVNAQAPASLNNDPDVAPVETAGESTSTHSGNSEGERPRWQMLVDKYRNVFSKGQKVLDVAGISAMCWYKQIEAEDAPTMHRTSERLIVAAPGGVGSDFILDEETPIEGGRLVVLDFSLEPHDGTTQEITIELGKVEPLLLEEQKTDMEAEIAKVRRRTMATRDAARVRSVIDALRPNNDLEDIPDVPEVPGSLAFGTETGQDTGEHPDVSDDDEPGVSVEEAAAFAEGPYSHTNPRSRTALYRSATISAASRQRLPQTRHFDQTPQPQMRRTDGTEVPDESDADNWRPPPPPYQRYVDEQLPDDLVQRALLYNNIAPIPHAFDDMMRPRRSSSVNTDNRSTRRRSSVDTDLLAHHLRPARPGEDIFRAGDTTAVSSTTPTPRSSIRRRPITTYTTSSSVALRDSNIGLRDSNVGLRDSNVARPVSHLTRSSSLSSANMRLSRSESLRRSSQAGSLLAQSPPPPTLHEQSNWPLPAPQEQPEPISPPEERADPFTQHSAEALPSPPEVVAEPAEEENEVVSIPSPSSDPSPISPEEKVVHIPPPDEDEPISPRANAPLDLPVAPWVDTPPQRDSPPAQQPTALPPVSPPVSPPEVGSVHPKEDSTVLSSLTQEPYLESRSAASAMVTQTSEVLPLSTPMREEVPRSIHQHPVQPEEPQMRAIHTPAQQAQIAPYENVSSLNPSRDAFYSPQSAVLPVEQESTHGQQSSALVSSLQAPTSGVPFRSYTQPSADHELGIPEPSAFQLSNLQTRHRPHARQLSGSVVRGQMTSPGPNNYVNQHSTNQYSTAYAGSSTTPTAELDSGLATLATDASSIKSRKRSKRLSQRIRGAFRRADPDEPMPELPIIPGVHQQQSQPSQVTPTNARHSRMYADSRINASEPALRRPPAQRLDTIESVGSGLGRNASIRRGAQTPEPGTPMHMPAVPETIPEGRRPRPKRSRSIFGGRRRSQVGNAVVQNDELPPVPPIPGAIGQWSAGRAGSVPHPGSIERAATAEPMGYFPTNQGFQTEITGGGGRRKKGKDKDGKCSIM